MLGDFEVDLLNCELLDGFDDIDFDLTDCTSTSSFSSLEKLDLENCSQLSQKKVLVKSARSRIKAQLHKKCKKDTLLRLQCFDFNPRRSTLENYFGLVAMHVNSANVEGLKELTYAYFARQCLIESDISPIQTDLFLKMIAVYIEMYPDFVILPGRTKATDNKLIGTLAYKCTDNTFVKCSAVEQLRHDHVTMFQELSVERSEFIRNTCLGLIPGTKATMTEDQFAALAPIVNTLDDLEIHGIVDIELHFDPSTKVVHHMTIISSITKIKVYEPVPDDMPVSIYNN